MARSNVVTSLAADLQREFPDQRGRSRSNLLYMRRAAGEWPTEEEFVHHVGGRLPWGHVTVLLDRLDRLETREERDWYAASAAEYGWSRSRRRSTAKEATVGALAPFSRRLTNGQFRSAGVPQCQRRFPRARIAVGVEPAA